MVTLKLYLARELENLRACRSGRTRDGWEFEVALAVVEVLRNLPSLSS